MHRRSFLACLAALPVLKWLPWGKVVDKSPRWENHTFEYSDEAKARFESVWELHDGLWQQNGWRVAGRPETPGEESLRKSMLPPTTARTSHA